MEIAVDAMLGVAGDDVDVAATFDDCMLARRNGQARHLDPAAGILRQWRDARYVALLLDGFRNFGNRFVVQPEEDRELLLSRHGEPLLLISGDSVAQQPAC